MCQLCLLGLYSIVPRVSRGNAAAQLECYRSNRWFTWCFFLNFLWNCVASQFTASRLCFENLSVSVDIVLVVLDLQEDGQLFYSLFQFRACCELSMEHIKAWVRSLINKNALMSFNCPNKGTQCFRSCKETYTMWCPWPLPLQPASRIYPTYMCCGMNESVLVKRAASLRCVPAWELKFTTECGKRTYCLQCCYEELETSVTTWNRPVQWALVV